MKLTPLKRAFVAALGMLVVAASPAMAQLSRNGASRDLGIGPVRGTDTAYDPVNHVYLLIGTTAGNTPFPLWGVFTNTNGDAVTAPFQINNPGNAQFPRARYSPDVNNGLGGFLVTWNGGPLPDIHTRVVAYPNLVVSPEYEISSIASFQESGPAIAYSTSSRLFLTVWRASTATIWGAIVNTNGVPGAPFQISQAGLGGRDPSVAWNPQTNEFGVLYSGWGDSAGATNTFARVNAGGSVLQLNRFNVGSTGTYVTDLAFNSSTGRFVGTWFQSGGTFGVELDGSGNVVTQGLLSTTTGTYDGLTIAYSPVSGTFLLAGQGQSYDIFGAELNSRGARTSADTVLTALGAYGAFYPRSAANTGAAQWDIAFGHQGGSTTTIANQTVSTSSSAGGPSGTLGSPTSTPTSTSGCPGTAPFPGAVCVNGGWVPGGTTTTTTSTGGCPGTAPFPGAVCVNGGWVAGTNTTTTSTGGCPGTAPFPGAVCVNGGWVAGTTSTTPASTGGCPGTAPFPGAVCVNGGWVPGGSTTTTTSTGSCPGTAPFPGAICVNGGWVPGGSTTTTSTGSCPGTAPFPGAICVNGGWVPGTGSCPGTAPFPGAVCVNGGWVPGTTTTSSCPGTAPFPGAICVNGGWVPGTSSCTSPAPGADWTCVNGGWLPPTMAGTTSTSSGGCTTPDPFTAIGGGICVNGGWVPKSDD